MATKTVPMVDTPRKKHVAMPQANQRAQAKRGCPRALRRHWRQPTAAHQHDQPLHPLAMLALTNVKNSG
jgi:hypothetical protein